MLWWINYIQGHSVIRCNSKSHQQVLALLLDRDSWQDCTSRFWLIKQIASPYLQCSQRYQCNTYRLVPEKRRGYFFNFLTNWCFRFVIMHLWPGFPPDLLIHRLELSSCVYWLEGFEWFCWNSCRTLSISIGKFSLSFHPRLAVRVWNLWDCQTHSLLLFKSLVQMYHWIRLNNISSHTQI